MRFRSFLRVALGFGIALVVVYLWMAATSTTTTTHNNNLSLTDWFQWQLRGSGSSTSHKGRGGLVKNATTIGSTSTKQQPNVEDGSSTNVEQHLDEQSSSDHESINAETTQKQENIEDWSSVERMIELTEEIELDDELPGFKPHPNVYSEVYLPRSIAPHTRNDTSGDDTTTATQRQQQLWLPMQQQYQQQLQEKWGAWTFVDPLPSSQRPQGDYYAQFPSRDIPYTKFPPNAWQIDSTYLPKFLAQGLDLVNRAMEAILTEYGHGKDQQPTLTFEERAEMFRVEIGVSNHTAPAYEFGSYVSGGGYMRAPAYENLVRRMLHAIVTQDTFRIVTGGHSVAAGHLNHFQQGYTVQSQRILEPILARLGVTFSAHSIAVGGIGTLMNAMAAQNVYSDDVDILLYDAGFTEPEYPIIDFFLRQGVISSTRKVPFLWIKQDFKRVFQSGVYDYLDRDCHLDMGVLGTGMSGIPRMETFDDLQNAPHNLPWATQYLNCDMDIVTECRQHEFMMQCWVDREDKYQPKVLQETNTFRMGGGSHPGNRFHQLQGRVMAFVILQATQHALELWHQADNYVLDDRMWHLHDHYRALQSNLLAYNRTITPCWEADQFPPRVCHLRMQGRSEFTPRVHSFASSIRSIATGTNFQKLIEPNEYDPPDVPNPVIDLVGRDDVDVVGVIENGVPFAPLLGRRRRRWERRQEQLLQTKLRDAALTRNASRYNPNIRPGLGWGVSTLTVPDNCDGSYDSFCGRSSHKCLLMGMIDNRGLVFDSLSGWLILNLEQIKHGLIILKIEDYHPNSNARTAGWMCENNDCPRSLQSQSEDGTVPDTSSATHQLNLTAVPTFSQLEQSQRGSIQRQSSSRKLGRPTEYCDDFAFDFAVDGQITTWNLTEWQNRQQIPARFIQLWTLLDDPNYMASRAEPDGGDESVESSRNVELAIRMRGCQRQTCFYLTHVYWA